MNHVNCHLAVVTARGIRCRGEHHAKPNVCYCIVVCSFRQRMEEKDPPHNCSKDGGLEFGTLEEIRRRDGETGCDC
jgi:hypothetical protein